MIDPISGVGQGHGGSSSQSGQPRITRVGSSHAEGKAGEGGAPADAGADAGHKADPEADAGVEVVEVDAEPASDAAPPCEAQDGGDAGADIAVLDAVTDPDGSTTVSAPMVWQRDAVAEMPAGWANRDGAQMVQLATGRVLMIGGWNSEDPWGPLGGQGTGNGGDRTTNEVWASDDLGVTWTLLLAHDAEAPTSGPTARFLPGHTVGLATYNGHAVLIGSDPGGGEDWYTGDVWQESNDGVTWTRVSTTAPTLGRALFMCSNYAGAIYVMGGQTSLFDPATAMNDVWRSTDGGLTWTQLPDAPWAPRGIVYQPVESNGKLYVIGGGRYAVDPYQPVALNGVFAFDGSSWQTVLPDGHAQFESAFYNGVTSLNGRLWLFNGYDSSRDIELSRAVVSDDNGLTWSAFVDGSGGAESHADSVVVASGRILRVSGNMKERTVHAFSAH